MNGKALIAGGVGVIFLWSAFGNKKVTSTIQSLIQGQKPVMGPGGNYFGSTTGGTAVGPAGPGAVAWARAILKSLGAPENSANINSLVAWQQREGANSYNNPLNTTLQTSGSTGTFNSAGVQEYGSAQAGVLATIQTLIYGYPTIVNALKSGQGLIGNPSVSGELSTWSGGGYSSL